MQIPLQVIFRNLTHSDAIEAEVRKRVAKLEQFYEHIMGCRVTVETVGKHQHQGKLYNVHVDLTVPGGEVVVTRDHSHEDVYVAIRDALDSAKRKLEDHIRRQRGQVKAHEQPAHGRVVRLFEEGYGFIETSDGRELYFDRSNVVDPSFEQLQVGTEVQFLEEMGSEGLQAKRVSAGRHHYA